MRTPSSPRSIPVDPAPPRPPAAHQPPAHIDTVLESLGKAIIDPVREAAHETDETTAQARRRALPDADAPRKR